MYFQLLNTTRNAKRGSVLKSLWTWWRRRNTRNFFSCCLIVHSQCPGPSPPDRCMVFIYQRSIKAAFPHQQWFSRLWVSVNIPTSSFPCCGRLPDFIGFQCLPAARHMDKAAAKSLWAPFCGFNTHGLLFRSESKGISLCIDRELQSHSRACLVKMRRDQRRWNIFAELDQQLLWWNVKEKEEGKRKKSLLTSPQSQIKPNMASCVHVFHVKVVFSLFVCNLCYLEDSTKKVVWIFGWEC